MGKQQKKHRPQFKAVSLGSPIKGRPGLSVNVWRGHRADRFPEKAHRRRRLATRENGSSPSVPIHFQHP